MIKQVVTITAAITAQPGTVIEYQWKINDSAFAAKEPVAGNIRFAAAGNYTIECIAVVGDVNSPCSTTASQVVQVTDNGKQYEAGVLHTSPRQEEKAVLKWWAHAFFLVPAAAGLFYSLYKRKKTAPSKDPQTPGGSGGKPGKQPYEVPFERTDIKLVQPDRDLRRTLLQMRYKAEEEYLVLNVPGTIASVIRSGGSPQLVYVPLTRQQEYLIIIDRSNPKSMMTHLFGYLAGIINDNGIPVTIFYYDKNFTCFNSQHPGGISLQRLAETHGAATLIIMGKAHELVYRAYAVIEEKFLTELNRWEQKAIITPIPAGDWGAKEKVLQEYMILIPADVMALQKLIPSLKEKIKLKQSHLDAIEEKPYTTLYVDFREVDELKQYLDNDAVLFQWLCAICVYPRLRWEVVVETGKAILDKNGQPEKLNYSNLLKLSRIAWMQDGVFPQATRLELLKQLTIENELCARETLLRMFNYSSMLYKGDNFFFEEEKKRQQLTSEFVLYSSDNKKYSQFENSKELFKQLWQNNAILDVPLKKYLEQPTGSNWQTPVQEGRGSVGLATYFKGETEKATKPSRIKRIAAGIGAVLLIGFWGYLGLGNALNMPVSNLYQYGSGNVALSIAVQKNFQPCGDTATGRFDVLTGNLVMERKAGNRQVVYNKQTGIATINLPIREYEGMYGNGQLTLNWGDADKTVVVPISFIEKTVPDSISIGCSENTPAEKIPLYIRYNDVSAYNQSQATLAGALYNYNVSALEEKFTDPSRIVYYNDGQKARADSVAQIIQQSMGIAVKTELVREDRTPPPVPILFLNLSSLKDSINSWTEINVAGLPATLNEIWTGRTLNRLMNIDIKKRLLWYSTNDRNTYGTYRIDAVYRNAAGTYKVIALGDKQYKVFMIRNVRQGAFELAACQDFAANKQMLLDKDDAYCGIFHRMVWYYANNPAVVYLPFNGAALAASEKIKMDRKADSINRMVKPDEAYTVTLYSNEKYAVATPAQVGSWLTGSRIGFNVRRNNTPINLTNTTATVINNATPFNRSYLVVTPKGVQPGYDNNPVDVQQTTGPDCAVTYYSIEDVRKTPLKICKLDLSKAALTELPKELFECKNMQQLTLGQTAIPEASIKNLQASLPKCNIAYTLQPKQPQKDTTFHLAREISFRSPGKLTTSDVAYLNTLKDVMLKDGDARVKLVAYYKDKNDQEDARSNVAEIKGVFINRSSAIYANQVIEQVLPEARANGPAKSSAYEMPPVRTSAGTGPFQQGDPPTKVTIYISGFPASFTNSAPKKS
jgi:hypothetical protein